MLHPQVVAELVRKRFRVCVPEAHPIRFQTGNSGNAGTELACAARPNENLVVVRVNVVADLAHFILCSFMHLARIAARAIWVVSIRFCSLESGIVPVITSFPFSQIHWTVVGRNAVVGVDSDHLFFWKRWGRKHEPSVTGIVST